MTSPYAVETETDYWELGEELGLRLRRAGNQGYGRCPLHADHNPSFTLNLPTGQWTCHQGCGPAVGRDFIKLVELVNGVSRAEARSWVRLRSSHPDVDTLSARLDAMLNPQQLQPLPTGQVAFSEPEWLQNYRACSDATMPLSFLRRGFTWRTIKEWGIRYDAYAERVLLPVFDGLGQVAGVVARTAREDGSPKYLNSPGLPRERILAGMGREWTHGTIILVEGLLDAIWLQQHGFRAVAVLGDSLSLAQIDILKMRSFANIILAFDADAPGQKGIQISALNLFNAGWLLSQLFTVDYPTNAKDFQDIKTPVEINATLKTAHYLV